MTAEATLAEIGATAIRPTQLDVRVAPRTPATVPPALRPNTWSADGDEEWLWLGPDEWLAVSRAHPGDLLQRLEAELAATPHAIVDVSASRTVFDLSGEGRIALLSAGCGLDLHDRRWYEGRCAQTLLARVPVILQERRGSTRVFVRPSSADWLVAWLADAARRATG